MLAETEAIVYHQQNAQRSCRRMRTPSRMPIFKPNRSIQPEPVITTDQIIVERDDGRYSVRRYFRSPFAVCTVKNLCRMRSL